MKKIKKLVLIIFLFLIFIFLFVLIKGFKNNRTFLEEFYYDTKKILLKIKNRLYFEATKYNPAGDIIPDELDDIAKDKIKNSF